MAQVRAARGDHEAAMRLLEEAAALYRHGFYPDVRPIEAIKARVQISAGDLDAAAGWARERALDPDDEDPDYLHEYEHLTLARLLLAQNARGTAPAPPGEPPPLTAVHALLGRLHDAAADTGRDGSLLEIRMLQALAHHADGDRERRSSVLGQALTETPEPEGHVRLFLDEGDPMLDLLRDAAAGRRPRRRAADLQREEDRVERGQDQREMVRAWLDGCSSGHATETPAPSSHPSSRWPTR